MSTVLLIDDDQEFVAKMHTLMARRCELLVVSNLRAAASVLKRTQVDFILLRRDSLPDNQSGLAKWLKKRKMAQIPVVILGENRKTGWWELLQSGVEAILRGNRG